MDTARVWALLYSRAGDNSQALALANSLGLPFEPKPMRYNKLRSIGRFLGPSLWTLDRPSRQLLDPPWPDAVVAIGRWSVPVARAIKARSGGQTKIIFLGNPRVDLRHFDLVVATRDYLIPSAENVVVAPLPVLTPLTTERTGITESVLASMPHPRTLVLVGGPVKYWRLAGDELGRAIAQLAATANERGGSIMVSPSQRTPDALIDMVRDALSGADHFYLATCRQGGLAALYDGADEIFVTGDSMTMITEAILTGKPVGVLPLSLSKKGRRKLGLTVATSGPMSKRRDLRRFWSALWAEKLAGTLALPVAASLARSTAFADRVAATALGLIAAPTGVALAGAGKSRGSVAGFATWVTQRADGARRNVGALSLAAVDSQTPWYAKLVAGASTMLAISPVDFTPDSLPFIGHLDDPILMVLGTMLAIGFIPRPLMAELRRRASMSERGSADHGALAIFLLWIAAGLRLARLIF